MDIGRYMSTVVPVNNPNTEPPSGLALPTYSNQKIPGLLTGGQRMTGKYNGRKVPVLLGHRTGNKVLGDHTDMVPSHQGTSNGSHKGGA